MSETFKELVAYTFTFVPLDTGRRAWSFVICVAGEIEGRDGDSIVVDIDAYSEKLWAWARDKPVLTLTDVDGTDALVQLVGFREIQPVIGPNVGDRPEAHFACNFLEVATPAVGL